MIDLSPDNELTPSKETQTPKKQVNHAILVIVLSLPSLDN